MTVFYRGTIKRKQIVINHYVIYLSQLLAGKV